MLLIVGIEIKVEENVVITAVRQVLNDDSFKISSPVTVEARKQAESLLEWSLMYDNKVPLLNKFRRIKREVLSSSPKSFHYNKGKMWRGFFHNIPQRALSNSGLTFWEPPMCQLNQFCINI